MGIDTRQEKRFNVRAAVPGHLQIFADWRARSDAYKAASPAARLDLPYGDDAAEKLDFFPAADGGDKTPVALLIHGGYWQAMDKADNAFAAAALNRAGAGVAVLNHTLCPDASLEKITDQIRRASLWLWRNAEPLNADPDRLYVIGHSAGGHLAAMMMCADWRALDANAPSDLFKGGVAISGLFDLTELVETTINDKLGLTGETAAALSPVNHAPASPGRFIAAVGGDESDGFHRQADALQRAWSPHGVNVERMSIPGCHHFQALEAIARADAAIRQTTLDLIFS